MTRILTPDEVNGLPTLSLQWMEFKQRRGNDLLRIFLLDGHRAKNRMREYGHTWRIWSDKPTNEQREATPWPD